MVGSTARNVCGVSLVHRRILKRVKWIFASLNPPVSLPVYEFHVPNDLDQAVVEVDGNVPQSNIRQKLLRVGKKLRNNQIDCIE